ncbi:unnamed protein product [Brugia timori]|uniref:Ig-like domain-containing protein n=1 Tax=Brugia timori TaxID=42155 RepID=A0A0R3Q5V6_9BILA|nr:unnamed protein product [Brugia timori]
MILSNRNLFSKRKLYVFTKKQNLLITNDDASLCQFEQLIIMYPATFLITILVAHLNAIVPTHNSDKGLRPWLQTGPPRFKQNQRVVHEVFLNDKAIFKCTALARPAPKVYFPLIILKICN